MVHRATPWRVLRPFSRFPLHGSAIKFGVSNNLATTFLLISAWVNIINPGDEIELIDTDDLHVWVKGRVISVEKIEIRNVDTADLVNSISGQLIDVCPDHHETCNLLHRMQIVYEDDTITDDTIIAVVRFTVQEVNIPVYRM